MEVFSPGRFAEMASGMGFTSVGSFDISDGWDWRKAIHRRRAEELIALTLPDVLVMTPPCGPLSRLQQCTPLEKRRNLEEHMADVENAVDMVRWCLRQANKQLAVGKHYFFEATATGETWDIQEMREFCEKWNHPKIDVAACAVGLKDKVSHKLFGKRWRIMTSSVTVAMMLEPLVCSRDHDHEIVEGSSGGQLRSVQSQVYPKRLIRKILGGFLMDETMAHACTEITQSSTICCPISQATIQDGFKTEGRRKIEAALRKLHTNLGHASTQDMLRILQHHGAQPQVLEMVKAFECDICRARQGPKAVKDSTPPKDIAPLRYIGLDVKWLPTWKPGLRIKALNIVCRSSGLQHMYPFREGEQECSEVIARLYRQWTRSFGRPKYCKFDASRCNLGQLFMDCLERDGTVALDIPGEAHEQLGDVETQGRHFEDMLVKVITDVNPQSYPEWHECVDCTVEARNMLLKRQGHSAYQLVFGRSPEIPGDDILGDQPNVIANSAILEDAIAEFSHRARIAAKQAVIAALDHRAARIALNSRPRPTREFRPGDEVAVWRRGRGIKRSTARWRGPGIVAGNTGGNYWVSMPGSFIKCSPEQLRLRTTEEREADRFLVRDLRSAAAQLYPEVGFSGRTQKNFIDLTNEDRPPGDLLGGEVPGMPDCRAGSNTAAATPATGPQEPPPSVSAGEQSGDPTDSSSPPTTSSSSLQENLSRLSDQEMRQWEQSRQRADRLDGLVRDHPQHHPQEPDPKRLRTDEQQHVGGQVFPPSLPPPQQTGSAVEVGSSNRSGPVSISSSQSQGTSGQRTPLLQDDYMLLGQNACVVDSSDAAVCLSATSAEVQTDNFVLASGCDSETKESTCLLAGGRNEINLKEDKWKEGIWKEKLRAGIQKEVTNVIDNKKALKPLSLEESRQIRQQQGDRIVPSKLVLTVKMEDSGEEIVKARWTARGDKDPDLFSLVREGKTQAPTISSNGRFTVLQVIASSRYELQLGDVTGAFLESDRMERVNGRLFMSMPNTCPLPGYHPEQLFEVILPIYGLNDSPQNWFVKWQKTVKEQSWQQSRMDPCVFFLRDRDELVGILGVHVDDVIIGGRGEKFQTALTVLRETFPFRKWQKGQGSFCGAQLQQCPDTFEIKVSQEEFVDKLQKPKLRMKEDANFEVNEQEVSSLRSCLGGALWLEKETRPDLAVQVSQGQQIMPRPSLGQARGVANIVRRAKQYRDMSWKILPIPLNRVRLCLHTDAAFGNAKGKGTQAGYIVGVTDPRLQEGAEAPWAPALWRSYRLKRVVGSTFAGETQVLADGLGHVEWVACHLAEAIHKNFSLSDRGRFVKQFQVQSIVDCKSIYDHVQQFASPGSISDKRVAIDIIIVKETLSRIGGVIRWCPTWLQLADALTKESAEAMDILRGAICSGKYHLHAESKVMEAAAEQRQLRLARRSVQSAEVTAQASQVLLVRDALVPTMVKVDAKGFSETQVRSLFECMVSEFVKDDEEFQKHLTQNQSMCKAKVPAKVVDTKVFSDSDVMVTYTYHKTTGMITVTAAAVVLDGADKMMAGVLKGATSLFLENSGEIGDEKIKDLKPQPFIPKDEEYSAAIADLCGEVARRLHNYPVWKQKLLQVLLQDFGASPDQIIELAGLTDHFDIASEDWGLPDASEGAASAKAKCKPSRFGYRATSP